VVWAALLVLLCVTPASGQKGATAFSPIEMTIAAKTGNSGQWCAEPIFEATVKNSTEGPIWLDMGRPTTELVVTGYSVYYSTRGTGEYQGRAIGRTDDWGSIEVLRGPDATLLRPGATVARLVKLKDVRLKSGRATLDLSVRIHGTEDLRDSKVRTYRLKATEVLGLRPAGRCLAVRRLTGR
jgi:hypothetical protein